MKYIFLLSKLAFLYFVGLNLTITLVLLNKAYNSTSRYLYMGFIVALLNYLYGLWFCIKTVLLLVTFMMLLYKEEVVQFYNIIRIQLQMSLKNKDITNKLNTLYDNQMIKFTKLKQAKSFETMISIYNKVYKSVNNPTVQIFVKNIDKTIESFYNIFMEAFNNFVQTNPFINNLKNHYISYNDFDKLKKDNVVQVDLNSDNIEMNKSLDKLMKEMPSPEQMFNNLHQNNMSTPPDPMMMMSQLNDMVKMLDTLKNIQPPKNMKKFS